MKIRYTLLIILSSLIIFGNNLSAQKVAGFRASRILGSYPNRQFPNSGYWSYVGKQMAQKFNGYSPAGVWIVGLYLDSDEIMLNFPSQGVSVPSVEFGSTDQNEEYLTRFDNEGIKIWLQIEPGPASVDTLISIVLNRYKNHPCIAGFGIDVEWLNAKTNSGGRTVTDAEAKRWEEKVKSINSSYTLFLKHYSQRWMPSTYRGNILFIDDSQGFTSFSNIISEFKAWGNSFPKNNVGFQFGYAADKPIWSQFADPPKQIGDELIKQIPNCSAIFWVDFTVTQIFPVTGVNDKPVLNSNFRLNQNYPNPFNPSTKISYQLNQNGKVSLTVYDLLGREIIKLVDKEQPAGTYEISFSNYSEKLSSGTYIYRLVSNGFAESKKFTILK
jgi:hypothetical protein